MHRSFEIECTTGKKIEWKHKLRYARVNVQKVEWKHKLRYARVNVQKGEKPKSYLLNCMHRSVLFLFFA